MSVCVTLVVPCYNEAERLDSGAFLAALELFPGLRFVFVDDGSTDATALLISTIERQFPDRIELIQLSENHGKAEAVRQGLLNVLSKLPTDDLCGFWDADLSAPLTELPVLCDVFSRNAAIQWVWGVRLRSLGRNVARRALRHYLGRMFATLSSVVLGIDSYDTQCGAKLFRANQLLKTALSEPFLSKWIFDVELLVRAQALLQYSENVCVQQVVFEQPLGVWVHRSGSKVRSGDFLVALKELFLIRRKRSAWFRPLSIS